MRAAGQMNNCENYCKQLKRSFFSSSVRFFNTSCSRPYRTSSALVFRPRRSRIVVAISDVGVGTQRMRPDIAEGLGRRGDVVCAPVSDARRCAAPAGVPLFLKRQRD